MLEHALYTPEASSGEDRRCLAFLRGQCYVRRRRRKCAFRLSWPSGNNSCSPPHHDSQDNDDTQRAADKWSFHDIPLLIRCRFAPEITMHFDGRAGSPNPPPGVKPCLRPPTSGILPPSWRACLAMLYLVGESNSFWGDSTMSFRSSTSHKLLALF